MDPFSDKFQNEGSNVWNRFYAFVSDFGFDEPDFVTASKFVNSEKLDFLFDTFNEIKESEWDDLRFNYPYSFRMKEQTQLLDTIKFGYLIKEFAFFGIKENRRFLVF